jgi:hypothetical protein
MYLTLYSFLWVILGFERLPSLNNEVYVQYETLKWNWRVTSFYALSFSFVVLELKRTSTIVHNTTGEVTTDGGCHV